MADMDEDVARLPSNDASTHIETDLSDETQDFRMLNHLSLSVLLREPISP
jgi:tRNA-splicing endonuclease subunit Sen54